METRILALQIDDDHEVIPLGLFRNAVEAADAIIADETERGATPEQLAQFTKEFFDWIEEFPYFKFDFTMRSPFVDVTLQFVTMEVNL